VNEYFEKDIERLTKRILTLLEPLILIGFGGFAALIFLSPLCHRINLSER
jgi:type II secretory pathway component PulF